MIKIMGINIMRKIATDIHASPFITIMADETADTSNVEQVSIFIRYITDLKFLRIFGVYVLFHLLMLQC